MATKYVHVGEIRDATGVDATSIRHILIYLHAAGFIQARILIKCPVCGDVIRTAGMGEPIHAAYECDKHGIVPIVVDRATIAFTTPDIPLPDA